MIEHTPTLSTTSQVSLPRRLEGGLILRSARIDDAEALADFDARIHSDEGFDQPNEGIRAWVLDMATRPHPTFRVDDFLVVEDPAKGGQIVASTNLIPQTWTYAGIPFPVGRPELVGVHPDYRNRGLVRAQFDVLHAWCAERNMPLQAITGIPYYYRLFGYEMTVQLGGGRMGFMGEAPKLPDGQSEPYRLRPAVEADIPFLMQVDAHAAQRNLLYAVRDEQLWHYDIAGQSPSNVNRRELRIIESANGETTGEPVGFLAHPHYLWWNCRLAATSYELKPGASWAVVTPSVIRYLIETGKAYAAKEGDPHRVDGYHLGLGDEHPCYATLHTALERKRKPYGWYIRIPDLPDFLRRITPVLEQRLENSIYAGYSGNLELSFYRSGVRMVWERGRLASVTAWRPQPQGHSGSALFPDLTFLQLLTGYRSMEELSYAFVDCVCNDDQVFGLLDGLFPKQISHVWPIH